MNAAAAAAQFARHVETEGTLIRVRWTETTGGTVRPDTGARTGGTVAQKTKELKVFRHETEADVRSQRFAQTEVGELFLDFVPGELDFLRQPAAGVEISNVVFTVNGQDYTQSRTGQSLAIFHDAVHAGVAILSTARLTRLR